MKRSYNPDKAGAALKRAAQMPQLFHRLPDQDFDIMKSEVARWLSEQPEIRQAIFDWCSNKGAIVFKDRRWRGVQTDGAPTLGSCHSSLTPSLPSESPRLRRGIKLQ